MIDEFGTKRRLFHGIFQCFARRELGHFLRFDLDCLSGLEIASHPGYTLGYLKGSEPGYATVPPFFSTLEMALKTASTAPAASFIVQVNFSTSLIILPCSCAPLSLVKTLTRTWMSINSYTVKYQLNIMRT
jgi:hypothetical protein